MKTGNDDFDAFAPRENVRIKKKGGGLNFVHGGASLQEMVVPVIDYYNIDTQTKVYKHNKDKFDTKPVKISLNCANHKISNYGGVCKEGKIMLPLQGVPKLVYNRLWDVFLLTGTPCLTLYLSRKEA